MEASAPYSRRVPFAELLAASPVMLGEGAVIERLRRSEGIQLDEQVVNSALIYQEAGRAALETICRQYLDIGRRYNLPLLLSTPTWRAGRERIASAGLASRDLNGDNVRFLTGLRDSYGDYARQVAVCGLMSCRGDAYKPAEAMTAAAAEEFHAWQAEALASAGVDFLLAATLPALSEAVGLARAQAATGLPYMISFVVRPEGTLLDGTPLNESIAYIDAAAAPPPLAYLINCTHASVFRSALLHMSNSSPLVRERVIGLLANTSPLSPEELDASSELAEEPPETFGRDVSALYGELGMKILGGCCGTDERHIECLAGELASRGYAYDKIQTFSNGATAPAVSGYRHFKANNSGATSITTFTGGYTGQTITVFFSNSNTTLVQNFSVLWLSGGVSWTPVAGSYITLQLADGVWREVSRRTA